jgi:hypothetical protein
MRGPTGSTRRCSAGLIAIGSRRKAERKGYSGAARVDVLAGHRVAALLLRRLEQCDELLPAPHDRGRRLGQQPTAARPLARAPRRDHAAPCSPPCCSATSFGLPTVPAAVHTPSLIRGPVLPIMNAFFYRECETLRKSCFSFPFLRGKGLARRANTLKAGEATHGDGAPAKANGGKCPAKK